MTTAEPAPAPPAGAPFSASDGTFVLAPKALLHDHLDGGLRPQSVLELAAEIGHELPADNAEALGDLVPGRRSNWAPSERYLETFDHTVAVMQSPATWTGREECARPGGGRCRVRRGAGRPRAAPRGGARPGRGGRGRPGGLRARAGPPPRPAPRSASAHPHRPAARRPQPEIAELAVRHRDHGVCGFDIAGAEAGYPPSRHLDAFDYLHRENFHVTIHAGEASACRSIWEAVQVCGADRLGHGVRIVDDIELLGGRDRFGRPRAQLGRLAAWVRDSRIPLELCPSSNVQTGAAPTVGQHPVTMLKDLRSQGHGQHRQPADVRDVSPAENLAAGEGRGGLDPLRTPAGSRSTLSKSAFIPFDERLGLIEDVVKPGYAALGLPR